MSNIKNVVSSCSSQFEPLAIKMQNEETGLVQELDLVKGSFIKMTTNGPESDNVSTVLNVKGKYSLSDKAYHELAQVTKELPRLHQLKCRAKELNGKQTINPTPEEITGVQQSVQDRVIARIRHAL